MGGQLTEPLGQIRVAVSPLEDMVKNIVAAGGLGLLKPLAQHLSIAKNQIAKGNALGNIEGRAGRIADQLGGVGHAKQHKAQPCVGWVSCALIVERAQSGKEIVA